MEGYAKLGSLMGAHSEFAIVRRFGSLNAENLLYLQAELVSLEHDLRIAQAEDNHSNHPDRARYSRDWYSLSRSINANDDLGPSESRPKDRGREKQWKIILQIREKLKDYSWCTTSYCLP